MVDTAGHLPFVPRVPFVDLLGIELQPFDGGASRLAFDPQPEHFDTFDVVHGGVTSTPMDVAMAAAARSVQKDLGVAAIELETSFMRPAIGRLAARGTLLHRTDTMAFNEVRVVDAHGHACAHAAGTFKYRPRKPATAERGAAGAGIDTD